MAVGTADYTMKNLNEKTNEEIEGFLKKSKEELFNLRFQSATGQLENTARLKAVKHDIARMYTILRERELGNSQAPEATETKAEEKYWLKSVTSARFVAVTSCPIRWTRRFPSSSSSVRPTRFTARLCAPLVRSRSMMNTTRLTLATS